MSNYFYTFKRIKLIYESNGDSHGMTIMSPLSEGITLINGITWLSLGLGRCRLSRMSRSSVLRPRSFNANVRPSFVTFTMLSGHGRGSSDKFYPFALRSGRAVALNALKKGALRVLTFEEEPPPDFGFFKQPIWLHTLSRGSKSCVKFPVSEVQIDSIERRKP